MEEWKNGDYKTLGSSKYDFPGYNYANTLKEAILDGEEIN